MDPAHLKWQFNQTKLIVEESKEAIAEVEGRKMIPNITKNYLEYIEQTKSSFENILKECEKNLVNIYKWAITEGIDVDDSRILKVYQFFYSKGEQITHLLRCISLPRGSNSIWGIVILIAIIFLWATV